MSVRLVIGRAGCGKTHHCVHAIREQLLASPLRGPRLILLVPEQASLQMERALLAAPLQAMARGSVLSFRRLAYRILQATRQPERLALSAAGRAMVLRAIVGRMAGRLRYYRRVERLGGFFERLGRTLEEFIAEAVAPGDLRAAMIPVRPGRTESPAAPTGVGRRTVTPLAASAKFADLVEIYQAYLDYLGDRYLDPSQALQLARDALPGCDWFDGARIWVDGFAGFTGQETLLLAALAGRAEQIEITALVDPDFPWAGQSDLDSAPGDLFAKPQRTCRRLVAEFGRGGQALDPAVVLDPASPPRFQAGGDLGVLERALAAPDSGLLADESGDGPELPGQAAETAAAANGEAATDDAEEALNATSGVHMVAAPDRRVEVDFAVAHLCRLVQNPGGLRYRDVAVIVRDLEPYHDLLSAALTERHIPFFIDHRRATTHHPVVEFLRAVLGLAIDAYAPDPVRLLLKTGLLDLSTEEADELENYILAHGLRGRELWLGADWPYRRTSRRGQEPTQRDQEMLVRVNQARRSVLHAVAAFVELSASPQTGSDWAAALQSLLERNGVGPRLESWARAAEADGQVDLAEEHRQVWRDAVRFLEEMGRALVDARLDVAELGGVVEAGLAQLTLGLVPPTVDQVLVGSIERSRHPELKAAIILGFNDGVFPALGAEDAILNDEDRDWLTGRNVSVGVTRRQRVLEERLLVYIAVTRPSTRLLVTMAEADAAGTALRPSPYAAWLGRALPGLRPRHLDDPLRTRGTWDLTTVEDLAGALAAEFRHRPPLAADPAPPRAAWNGIYSLVRGRSDCADLLRRTLSSLIYRNNASLSAETVQRLITQPYAASVSELESFAACPFQRFARYGLALQERPQAELEPTDLGTAHHGILEALFKDLLERRESLTDIPDNEVLGRLEECAVRSGQMVGREGERSTARDAYLLARSARDLSPVVRAQRKASAAGRFRPRAAEKPFGFTRDSDSLPALEIRTPQGRQVRLRGMIDRIDLAEYVDEMLGVVVDYKRTRDKRLDLSNVYYGLSLQLLGYLLVLAERGKTLTGRPIVPAGAFYVSLSQKYSSVNHPDEGEKARSRDLRPRGVLNAEHIGALDSGFSETRTSSVYNFARRKDGGIRNMDNSDGAEPEQFAALLRHVSRRMGELADGVLDGHVSVAPYRLGDFSPCNWCKMRPVCRFEFRFEFGDSDLRWLQKLSRSEVFRRIGGEAAGR